MGALTKEEVGIVTIIEGLDAGDSTAHEKYLCDLARRLAGRVETLEALLRHVAKSTGPCPYPEEKRELYGCSCARCSVRRALASTGGPGKVEEINRHFHPGFATAPPADAGEAKDLPTGKNQPQTGESFPSGKEEAGAPFDCGGDVCGYPCTKCGASFTGNHDVPDCYEYGGRHVCDCAPSTLLATRSPTQTDERGDE